MAIAIHCTVPHPVRRPTIRIITSHRAVESDCLRCVGCCRDKHLKLVETERLYHKCVKDYETVRVNGATKPLLLYYFLSLCQGFVRRCRLSPTCCLWHAVVHSHELVG